MKNLLIFVLAVLFFSCEKDNASLSPDCQAVTYYIDRYDQNWKYLRTDVSIHWCKVCGEDLARFKTYDKLDSICDETNLMRLVIGKDTCENK